MQRTRSTDYNLSTFSRVNAKPNKTNTINYQETPGIKLKPNSYKQHIVGCYKSKNKRNTITRMMALNKDEPSPSVHDSFLPVRCDPIVCIYRV